jgi:hypothetical protein
MGSTITASFLGFTSLLIDCRRRLLSSFGILERVSKTPPERNPEAGKVEERRVARSAFLRPRVSFDVSLRRHVVLQSQNPGCQSPPFPNPVTRVAVRSYLLTSPAPQPKTSGRAYEVTRRIFDHRLVHHMVKPILMASLPAKQLPLP